MQMPRGAPLALPVLAGSHCQNRSAQRHVDRHLHTERPCGHIADAAGCSGEMLRATDVPKEVCCAFAFPALSPDFTNTARSSCAQQRLRALCTERLYHEQHQLEGCAYLSLIGVALLLL